MVVSYDSWRDPSLHEGFVWKNQSEVPKSSANASLHHSKKSELWAFKTLGPVVGAFYSG